MLTYTILIRRSPDQFIQLTTALEFCKALLQKKHRITCLFLQFDAAFLGLNTALEFEDKNSIHQAWQSFIEENNIPAQICTNSALRRGVIDYHFAKENNLTVNLAPMIKLATLSNLFTSIQQSDRFIEL